jgi:hypothetical protein
MKDLGEKERQDFIEQITRESEPLALTNFMVDRPCTVLGIAYLALIVFAIATGILGYMMPEL